MLSPMLQTAKLLRTRFVAAAAHARLGGTMRSLSSVQNESATMNPFSQPEVRQQAIARWGLDYKGPSALVFPQGRPEIAALAKETTNVRIASGLFTRRRPNHDKEASAAHDPDQGEEHTASFGRRTLAKDAPQWLKHKMTIREKLGGKAWDPHRRVSRQTMEQIRYLRKQFPDEWTTPKLAGHFKISTESVVRILRSKYTPNEDRSREQDTRRQEIKKARIAESLEKLKTKRYLDWLRYQAANPSPASVQARKPRSLSHIKLGAPKRD